MSETKIKTPVVIDVTDATIDRYGDNHVLRDTDDTVVALCPLTDDLLPNGQFSYAPDIQRAVNSFDDMLAALKAVTAALNGRVHSRPALTALSDAKEAIAKAEAAS